VNETKNLNIESRIREGVKAGEELQKALSANMKHIEATQHLNRNDYRFNKELKKMIYEIMREYLLFYGYVNHSENK
jgi:hypothetical protein